MALQSESKRGSVSLHVLLSRPLLLKFSLSCADLDMCDLCRGSSGEVVTLHPVQDVQQELQKLDILEEKENKLAG